MLSDYLVSELLTFLRFLIMTNAGSYAPKMQLSHYNDLRIQGEEGGGNERVQAAERNQKRKAARPLRKPAHSYHRKLNNFFADFKIKYCEGGETKSSNPT